MSVFLLSIVIGSVVALSKSALHISAMAVVFFFTTVIGAIMSGAPLLQSVAMVGGAVMAFDAGFVALLLLRFSHFKTTSV